MEKPRGSEVRLGCDAPGCPALYCPRPRVFDVTATAAERAVLEGELRIRASRRGWVSAKLGVGPWRDLCPKHSSDVQPRDGGA